MSSSAIDQILQPAPTVRPATEPVPPTVSDRPAFQDHLERASSETLPSEDTEPLDTDGNDLTSADDRHDAASSQEEETSIATKAVVSDEDHESKEEPEQDAVELSDTAVALADVQISAENEAVVAPAEQPTVLTETRVEPTPNQQRTDKLTEDSEPAKEIEVQSKVVNKTSEAQAGVRKKSTTAERAVQTPQAKQPALESQAAQQPPQAEVETEEQESESPVDRKLVSEKPANEEIVRRDSNSQRIATKTEAPSQEKALAIDEPSVLPIENRPNVAASAPTPDTSVPLATAAGEDAIATQRSVGNSVASPAEAEPVPTADRARFIQRVSGAVRSAQSREGEIHLQLRPPELGSLRIEIVVKQGVLTAQLETETSAARAILLDNLPALRERLAEQEIRIEKFDVNVRDEGGQQPDHPGTEDRKTNRPQPETRHQQPTDGEQQAIPIAAALETSSTPNGGLDVRV